jgi:hypothetical protein
MRRALIVGGATAALALSSVGVALAGNDEPTPPEVVAQRGVSAPTTTTCNGGGLKSVKTVRTDSYFPYYEGGTSPISGATVNVAGPARGKDTVVVTFTGTTSLLNTTPGDYDSANLQARVDGTALAPGKDWQLAIASTEEYQPASAQFCGRIGSGTHAIKLFMQFRDQGNDDPLGAFLDDWSMKVEVLN